MPLKKFRLSLEEMPQDAKKEGAYAVAWTPETSYLFEGVTMACRDGIVHCTAVVWGSPVPIYAGDVLLVSKNCVIGLLRSSEAKDVLP